MKNIILLIIFFSFKINQLSAQDDEIYCFDVKAGFGKYSFSARTFNEKMNPPGSHGMIEYPYISATDVKSGITPYLSASCGIRYNKFFELYVGASYSYYKHSIKYYIQNAHDFTNLMYYSRTEQEANGIVMNHDYRIEFAPVLRIFNTKIMFYIFNLDVINRNVKMDVGTEKEYSIVSKTNSNSYGYYSLPPDSIKTEKSSKEFVANVGLKNQVFFPLSIGIEQEIPIRKNRYIVGVKGIYTARINNLSIVGYLGIRLSKEYTWKE